MKKLFALLLALMLMCAALPVLGEEAPHKHLVSYDDTMTVEIVIPDGYAVDESIVKGALFLVMEPMTVPENYFCTIIAHDEEHADVERLNDLSDEEVQALAEEFCEDLNNPTISYSETGMGTKLIVIDDNDVEDGDTVVVLTLYKGYLLTTYVFPVEGAVSEAEINKAIQFYTDMEFKF